MYGGLFKTKEEAEKYRIEHELYVMVAEYIPCRGKWALIFPLHAKRESKDCMTLETDVYNTLED